MPIPFMKRLLIKKQAIIFLTGNALLMCGKTLAQDAAFQKDQYLSVFVNSLEVARPRAYGPKYPQVSNAVQQAFQSAISGQMSASAALSQAAQTIKPLLG